MTAGRPRVLVIALGPVERELRGVAIRAFELAHVLTGVADVTLAGLRGGGAALAHVPAGLALAEFDYDDPVALRPLIAAADVVVAQPQPPTIAHMLARSRARLVFDLYDPEVFENLAIFAERRSRASGLLLSLTVDRLTTALRLGHHLICASESQRDLWIGAMVAERLVEQRRYADDPSFRSVIAVVPFGVPLAPPERIPGATARRAFPTIGPADRVVLWNGGIWSWLDPVCAVRAVGRLSERRDDVRLVFMGGSSHRAAEAATAATRAEAGRLGLCDRVVHLNESWVPYDQRGSWLLDADCAVSAQHDHLETRFAYRTRLLDCLWAGLPIACTRGDELAAMVEREDLGATAPPGDADALAAAIAAVLDRGRDAYAPQLARAAAAQSWPVAAAPLVEIVTGARDVRRASPGRRALGERPAQRLRSTAYRLARRAGAVRAARRG